MNTSDPIAGYAYWTSPHGSARVVYSLGVFQEIDASVNDGYRRIPHGGIEIGGVLFGTRRDNELHIEAFRRIECQHAYGPSFLLSESDLAGLREQLRTAGTDADLEGMCPLGWFVGHTRTPLHMTDREALWFEEFFPEAGSLSLLVKPERFQPTQFGFLLRQSDGRISRDASQGAIILPLSGQGSPGPDRASPSIPAPKMESRVDPQPASNRSQPEPPARESARSPEPARSGESTRIRSVPPSMPLSETAASGAPPRAFETRFPEPFHQESPPLMGSSRQWEQPPGRPASEPQFQGAPLPDRRVYAVERPRRLAGLNLKSAAVLLLAAILGCAAGYWAYLQLPSPVIPVSVREQRGQITVEWPAAQTDNVEYAAMEVNDGQWMPLTPEQKASGRASVTVPGGDVKIDLLAKHWLRDSRGIVHYIRTPRPVR